MILLSDLAQQIVDKIMSSTKQNINIMDSRGIIVGSGDKSRINTFHKGAFDAISRGQTVEIQQADLALYPGARPGLNMPIVIGDHIIGVVGISGSPDDVRDTAKMVKMVAEIILEREMLREEVHSQAQLQEQFAMLLLSDRAGTNYNKLFHTAKLLKYKLELPRTVLVANLETFFGEAFQHFGLNNFVAARARENMLQLLAEEPLVTAQDLLAFKENQLILLKHFPAGMAESKQIAWAQKLYQKIYDNHSQISFHIGLGSLAPAYTDLYQSYQEALFALKHSTAAVPLAAIYDFDILTAYLTAKIRRHDFCQPLAAIKARLPSDFSRKYDMKNTIICLLHNHLNIANTAKALFIHRNTLLFRLEKFREATALDPSHDLNHAILCKIIFAD